MYKLRRLKFLYLDNNRLEELSSDLAFLTELRVLTLANNDLRRLPHRALLRLDKLTGFNVKGNHKLSRREAGEEDGYAQHQNSQDIEGSKTKHGNRTDEVKSKGKLRMKKDKAVLTTKGKITFDDDSMENDAMRDEISTGFNDRRHNPHLDEYRHTPKFHEERLSKRGDSRLQNRADTFPRGISKSRTFHDVHDETEHTKKTKVAKRFSSVRGLRDFFLGRGKNKTPKSSPRESSINFDTRAALRASDSVHLPMNYHMDDIELSGDGLRSWNNRRSSHDTRNSSLNRHRRQPKEEEHYWPKNADESFHNGRNHKDQTQHVMRERDFYAEEDDIRHAGSMRRLGVFQGSSRHSMPRSYATSPELYHRDPERKDYEFYQKRTPRSGGSLRGRRPDRYREHHNTEGNKDFRHGGNIPLHFKPSQSWAGQGGTFYHGQDPRQARYDSPSSGPSWHQWGRSVPRSVQPSRDHSVREAYASFATETPYGERPSPDVKTVYFPELDYSDDSEDGGYTSNLRSYRSEAMYSDEESVSFNSKGRGNIQGSRHVYSSDDSLLNQEFGGGQRGRQHSSNYRHNRQRPRSVSPRSGPPSHRELRGLTKSNSLNFLHPGDPYNHESSRSSLNASRITDYVDCEDTPSSAAAPHRTATLRAPTKDHFPQFDHVLSTATALNGTNQTYPGSPRLTPVALQHGHFLMKKKPIDQTTVTRSRSLDSILDYSPRNSNLTGRNSGRYAAKDTRQFQARDQEDLTTIDALPSNASQLTAPAGENLAGADYSLLGVCSHVETMLNKNALRPGVRLNNRRSPRCL